MAKKSMIARDVKRAKTVARFAAKRAELKRVIRSPKSSDEERREAMDKLKKLPRNASPTRVVNRCEVTGRRHGYLRRFKMSRITFRELASSGQIPGVTKSSW